jgi:hypothetical protein
MFPHCFPRFLTPMKWVGAVGICWIATDSVAAAKRCDWHAKKALSGEVTYRKCLDLDAIEGTTITAPGNVTRIAQDGFSFCANAFKTDVGGEADIVYLLDNSGSMWGGENNGLYRTCAGDPFERRDDILVQAVHLQNQLASRTSAGFIPFVAEGKLQESVTPLEIGSGSASAVANLKRLEDAFNKSVVDGRNNTSTRTDPCEDFRDKLMKAAASAKTSATSWSQPLKRAIDWRKNQAPFSASPRPAIVLISDGAITDWNAVKALVPNLPPVYGIHLGYRLNRDSIVDIAPYQLDTLTQLTGGKFYRVAPSDTLAMRLVIAEIIKSVVTNPLPTSLKVTNQSLAVPQVSQGATLSSNPDNSVGIKLDSILALQSGENQLKVEVTLNDASVRNFNFKINVAGAEASRNSDNYTCYDMPTLALLDGNGKAPELYAGGAGNYTVDLTRSPSDLTTVTVQGSSADSTRSDAKTWGDKESIALPNPSMAEGFPRHQKSVPFNGSSESPTKNNGTLESNRAGWVTLTWSHPRDPRETVTYMLPGKIIPVVDPIGELQQPKAPVSGPDELKTLPAELPKIVISRGPQKEGDPIGTCVSGCETVKNTGVTPEQMPTWTIPVNAPFDYRYWVFDNLGQYITRGEGSLSQGDFDKIRANSDTAKAAFSVYPVSDNGRHIGTGAYIMHLEVTTRGELISRNAAGDEVRVRSTKLGQTRRFGYVRGGK